MNSTTAEAARRRPILSLRDAEVRTADGATLLAVHSLDIVAGERIVLTGPSGSGKSLLLATLTGRWPAGLGLAGGRTATIDRFGFLPQRGLDALHPLIPVGRQLRAVTGADGRYRLTIDGEELRLCRLRYGGSASRCSRASGTATTPTFGSIVQNGKFAASAPAWDTALKSVDLPTLGSPTMPTCRAMEPA
jgi:energy-coupling factor transporter ATP-binding protein EcfA2